MRFFLSYKHVGRMACTKNRAAIKGDTCLFLKRFCQKLATDPSPQLEKGFRGDVTVFRLNGPVQGAETNTQKFDEILISHFLFFFFFFSYCCGQIDYDSKLSTSHLRSSQQRRRSGGQPLAASHPIRCFVSCFRGDLTAIRR